MARKREFHGIPLPATARQQAGIARRILPTSLREPRKRRRDEDNDREIDRLLREE